jgi:predicted transcriptional regulator
METLARLASTHASEISRLEHGQRDPRLSTIVRIARGLDLRSRTCSKGLSSAQTRNRTLLSPFVPPGRN